MNTEHEGILVISCCILPVEDVILQILGADTLPEAVTCTSATKGYLWSFQTKYYSAEVNLYALEEKTALDPSLSSTIRAVVFYFDTQKKCSFDDVLSWMPFLKDIEADVQILVSNNCSEECDTPDLEKKSVLTWCIENQYELVELNTLSESDDEDDNSFNDVKGYDRVIQALQSHTWANLIMKNEKPESDNNLSKLTEDKSECSKEVKPPKCSETAGSNSASCVNDTNEKNLNGASVNTEELKKEEKWLDSVLNGEDPGGESFEALFARFASLKEKASGLSGDQRKKYAEKVAIAFWRAMGGDEDEIEGLDKEE